MMSTSSSDFPVPIPDHDNPRPYKRPRLSPSYLPSPSPLTTLTRLPPAHLLLALPALLLHPPTHKQHARSLALAQVALRRCLSLPNLDLDVECRAWAGLAEVGMCIGLDEEGVESEVERGITKASLIAQKHPSLRSYKPHLTLLSARLAHHQHNPRLAHTALRRLFSSFLLPSDPPHLAYSIHLGLIASLTESSDGGQGARMKILDAIGDMQARATTSGHDSMQRLAGLLRVRIFVLDGRWEEGRKALEDAEKDMGLVFDLAPPAKDGSTNGATTNALPPAPAQPPAEAITTILLVHLLLHGVVFYTHAGDAPAAMARLARVHALLDGGALDAFGESGIVQIPFPSSHPLHLQTTHPRVMYALVFLASSIAKRDPVGRKPKRRVFAVEGLGVVERETRKEIILPRWASTVDLKEVHGQMGRMKVDLLAELVGVAIMRSEFEEAGKTLSILTAHVRTQHIFSAYAGRITFLHAQLAHSLGRTEHAVQCYRVAAYLSRKREGAQDGKREEGRGDEEGVEDPWLNTAARAGEVWVRIGVLRRDAWLEKVTQEKEREKLNVKENLTQKERERTHDVRERELVELRRLGKDVIKSCESMGGTLSAIGDVLEACLATEFLKAKTHLRRALKAATAAQDNHLRALILALIAAHYVHTSAEHAQAMLKTADQLAAGLGAQPRKGAEAAGKDKAVVGKTPSADAVGNAPLRLWIGEQVLELHRWAGDKRGAEAQAVMNGTLRETVRRLEARAEGAGLGAGRLDWSS